MRLRVFVQDAGVAAAMKATRRDLNRDVRAAFREVGDSVLLPAAKAATPMVTGKLRRSIVFKPTTSGGYLTTSLTRRQGAKRLGLLEFGGTRRDVIRPRSKKALRLRTGVVVAVVGVPRVGRRVGRVYKAQGFLQRARDERLPLVAREIEPRIRAAIQRHIDRNSTYPI